MGNSKILFKTKELKSRSEVAAFLKQLAGKIEEGRVTLKAGAEETVLEMPDKLMLEVQADDKDKQSSGVRHTLEVEIKWYDKDFEGGSLELG